MITRLSERALDRLRCVVLLLACMAVTTAGCGPDDGNNGEDRDAGMDVTEEDAGFDTRVDAGQDANDTGQDADDTGRDADASMDADVGGDADGGDIECDPFVEVGESADRVYPELGWRWYYGQSVDQVKDRIDEGYRIVDLEVETVDPYTFSVAMVENSEREQKAWWWYFGKTRSQLDQKLSENGARPTDIEVYEVGGTKLFAAVMIENSGTDQISNWRIIADDTPENIVDEALADDLRPIDADPWQSNSGTSYSAVLIDNTGVNNRAWWLYYGQSESGVNNKLDQHNALMQDIDQAADGDFTVVMDQPPSDERPVWWFYGFDQSTVQHLFRRLGSRIIDVQRTGTGSDNEFLVMLQGWAYPRTGFPVDSLTAFDREVQQLMWSWNAPGASLAIMRHGRLVYHRSYGYANTRDDEAVQPSDRFRIASLTKPITRSAIFRLEDEGELSLSDPVFTQHLSNLVPSGGVADSRINNITIQHLLAHRAGWDIGNSASGTLDYDPMFADNKIRNDLGLSSPPSCEQRITYVLDNYQLDNAPGSNSDYSNFSYCILGKVIESVTGQSYESYTNSQILQPTGADDMQLGRTKLSQQVGNQVHYYDKLLDPEVNSVFPSVSGKVPQPYGGFYLEAMAAHGGWISTAADYVRYADRTNWPPYSGNWNFRGSLPGTQTAVQSAQSGDIEMALFLNTRQANWGQNDLLSAMNSALGQIEIWPCHDLDDGS